MYEQCMNTRIDGKDLGVLVACVVIIGPHMWIHRLRLIAMPFSACQSSSSPFLVDHDLEPEHRGLLLKSLGFGHC